MWYHQRGEQIAVLLFLCSLVLIKVVCFALWKKEDAPLSRSMAMDSMEVKLQIFAGKQAQKDSLQSKSKLLSPSVYTESWQPFDPNTADSVTLSHFGWSSFVVGNILKYRRHGGRYERAEDLKKIYGLTAAEYEAVKPYIRIEKSKWYHQKLVDSVHVVKVDGLKSTNHDSVQVEKVEQPLAPKIVCFINSADTAELIKIRGIGKYTAMQIIRYRDHLGGFYTANQLDEVPNVRLENLSVLKECICIDTSLICPISLNTADLEDLKAHPYIDFYQAKALIEWRKIRGAMTSMADIGFLEEFSPVDLERLRPYLSF